QVGRGLGQRRRLGQQTGNLVHDPDVRGVGDGGVGRLPWVHAIFLSGRIEGHYTTAIPIVL
ncbi:MAG: hypothetical protein ACHQ02_10550, partial [Candidatus Limnocylindrales bacterium]